MPSGEKATLGRAVSIARACVRACAQGYRGD
jgi:hypothetical protein